MEFIRTPQDDIVENAVRILKAAVKAADKQVASEHNSAAESQGHDAIRDMCRKYCDAHTCSTCKVGQLIDCDEDWCVVCMIATSAQPTEAMLTEVMRFEKEGDAKPRTYAEDYFARHPEALALTIEKNGIRMPHVCRVSEYEGVNTCPGGMTCWECWQKPVKG